MHTVTTVESVDRAGDVVEVGDLTLADAGVEPLAIAAGRMGDEDLEVLRTALERYALTAGGEGGDRAWRLHGVLVAGGLRGLVKGVLVVAIDDPPAPASC